MYTCTCTCAYTLSQIIKNVNNIIMLPKILVCMHDLIVNYKLKFLLVIGVRVMIHAQSADIATILTNKINIHALPCYCQPINISC